MRALSRRSRMHGEQGASLVIILLLISILGLSIGAIATQGTAGMLAVKGVANQRSDVYGAESAADAAINYMRGNLTRGRPGTDNCGQPGDSNPPTILTSTTDVGQMTVTCRAFASGYGIPVAGTNTPANAILTMGGYAGYPTPNQTCSGDPGICLDGNSSGSMSVSGSVFSNASSASSPSITGNNGTKLDAGLDSVLATGTCGPSGKITGTPVVCPSSNPPSVADPGGAVDVDPTTGPWASDIQSMPAPAPTPVCNTTTKVAKMWPGSYFSRNDMIAGFSSGTTLCTVVWMQPGDYYFAFDDAQDIDPWRIGYDDLQRSGSSGTNAAGRVVIGGTRAGWNDSTPASTVIAKVPGACDRSQPGVQVVLAGLSAFDVKHYGMLELCPDPNTDRQQIAIYGRKTDQAVSAQTVTYTPTATSGSTPASFGGANAMTINNVVATGTQSGSAKVNQVTLGGYGTSATLAPVVKSFGGAVLRVAHREAWAPSNGTVSITATITSGSKTCNTAVAFTKVSTLTTQTWSVPTSCLGSLDDVKNASVKWQVTGPTGGSASITSDLDGAEFQATYTPRGLEKKDDGSKVVWLYGAYPSSPTSERQPQVYIWGTVYAPTSRIELNFGDVSTAQARFLRGVIVDYINVNNLQVGQSYSVFSNAAGTHYSDRYVELIVSLNGRRLLRVVVRLTDSTSPGQAVQIVSWNAVN